MCRSYRPTLPVSYISQVLGFSSGVINGASDERDTDALEECSEWLKAHGGSIITDNNGDTQLDTKVCSISILHTATLVKMLCSQAYFLFVESSLSLSILIVLP